jgi:hypothetical protein
MSIQKKSLISNRVAVRKALIASQPAEEGGELKANSLTAQSMKSKRVLAHKAFRVAVFKQSAMKKK